MQQARTFVIRALIALAIAHGAAAQTAPTVVISPTPKLAFFDNSGRPLAGGCVATYAAGTTTPLQTFTDATGMVPNQNPVMLDASGRAGIWISVPSIKYVVKAKSSACSLSSGTILYTVDHVQDSGLLLRSDLAGANGAGNIGFQQPGGTPITVGAALSICPDASHYATFAAAIANVPAGGCLNVTTQVNGPVTISRAITLNGYPGGSVRATSSASAMTIANATAVNIRGLAVDGRFSQSAYTGSCIHVTGSSYVTIENSPSISNCGSYGVYFDSTTTIDQHVKVLNSTFTANQSDSLYAQGPGYDIEWAGNDADGSTNAPNTHTFGVHYGQAGTTPPHAVKIHDNFLKCAPNWCIEVGSFFSTAQTGWPYDVQISHNTCLIVLTGSGCESLSLVRGFAIDRDIIDAQNVVFFVSPEVIATNGTVHGEVQRNCNTNQTASFTLNHAVDVDVSGNSFCGSIYVGMSPPAANLPDLPMNGNRIHHNSITLQPGYTAAVLSGGGQPAPIWVQFSNANASMHSLDIGDNVMTGNSISDGTVGVMLQNDACTSTANIDQVHVHHNAMNLIQYGLGNVTNCSFITHVEYTNNLLGTGVAQFFTNANFPTITYSNMGFTRTIPDSISAPGISLTGTAPTFSYGPGAGTGPSGLSCLSGITCSPFKGSVFLTTGTAPAMNGLLFSINVAPGYFTARPVCLLNPASGTTSTVPLIYDNIGSTATRLDFYMFNGAAPASNNINESYICLQ